VGIFYRSRIVLGGDYADLKEPKEKRVMTRDEALAILSGPSERTENLLKVSIRFSCWYRKEMVTVAATILVAMKSYAVRGHAILFP